jgi:hypothetical protein
MLTSDCAGQITPGTLPEHNTGRANMKSMETLLIMTRRTLLVDQTFITI